MTITELIKLLSDYEGWHRIIYENGQLIIDRQYDRTYINLKDGVYVNDFIMRMVETDDE